MFASSRPLLTVLLVPFAALVLASGPQAPNIAFRVHLIDQVESETAAVADLNKDGRLDIISAESWYEAPKSTPPRTDRAVADVRASAR